MVVFIGADHRGFNLKQNLKQWLSQNSYQVEDVGAENLDPDDDYPQFAEKVASKVAANPEINGDRGIVICGSGVGVDIVANKFNGVRCGLGMNIDQVKAARADDNVNVLAIAADEIDEPTAEQMVKVFLETEFEDVARRTRRLSEIKEIEEKQ